MTLPSAVTWRRQQGATGWRTRGLRDMALGLLALGMLLASLLAQIQAAAALPASAVIERIQARGSLLCGVEVHAPGFSVQDEAGRWSGFDIEVCKALATAVLGDSKGARFRPLSEAERYGALARGEIDVLLGSGAWSMGRDIELGVRFVTPTFFDGQAFLVRRELGLTSVLELSGSKICFLAGTEAETNLRLAFGERSMRYEGVGLAQWNSVGAAYRDGRCNVVTGYVSDLLQLRVALHDPDANLLLSEVIASQVRGVAVAPEDPEWFSVVRWCVNALVLAEQLGVTRSNAASLAKAERSDMRKLFGGDGHGSEIGLRPGWVPAVISAVGNYGEIFGRTLGAESSFKLRRRLNDLWTRGGLLHALPMY